MGPKFASISKLMLMLSINRSPHFLPVPKTLVWFLGPKGELFESNPFSLLHYGRGIYSSGQFKFPRDFCCQYKHTSVDSFLPTSFHAISGSGLVAFQVLGFAVRTLIRKFDNTSFSKNP